MNSSTLPTDKPALRRAMSALRAEAAAQNPGAPKDLRENFLRHIALPPKSVVAGYSARSGEMDVSPLLDALAAKGHATALPVVTGPATGLLFRAWRTGDPLREGAFGILGPWETAAYVLPDVVLVPLLAFDRHRNRLGAGGGYYDRTFAALRKTRTLLAIGVGFACQEAPLVPTGPHDIRLDRIVTEIEVF